MIRSCSCSLPRCVIESARQADRRAAQEPRRNDPRPRNVRVLRKVVVQQAEAGKVLGHEPVLRAGRVSCRDAVAALEDAVDSQRALIGGVPRIALVDVIVGVVARADHGRLAVHRHAAHVIGVRLRHVLAACRWRARLNRFAGMRLPGNADADDLRSWRADRPGRVEVRVGRGAERIEDVHAAAAEIARDLLRRRHGIDHGVAREPCAGPRSSRRRTSSCRTADRPQLRRSYSAPGNAPPSISLKLDASSAPLRRNSYTVP